MLNFSINYFNNQIIKITQIFTKTKPIKTKEGKNMTKLNSETALALLQARPNRALVETIMADCEYDNSVCEKAVPQLKKFGYSADDFLDLIIKSQYRENVLRACGHFLNFKLKTEDWIFSFLEKSNYHWSLTNVILASLNIPSIKNQRLISLAAKFHREEIYKVVWPLLKIENISQTELYNILKEMNFCHEAKKKIAPFLTKEDYILELIKKTDGTSRYEEDEKVLAICFKQLRLNERSYDNLLELAGLTKFHRGFCCELIRQINSSDYIMIILDVCKCDSAVAIAAIEKLKIEEQIMMIARKHRHLEDVSLAVIAKVSEKYLMEIWDWKAHNAKINEAIVLRLDLKNKSEQDLTKYIRRDEYGSGVAKACLPYFNLKKRNLQQIISLLEACGFNKAACQLYLSPRRLKKLNDQELNDLFVLSHYHAHVGAVLIDYLRTEKFILDFVMKSKYYTTCDFWKKALAKIFAEKNDLEIFNLLKFFHNDREILRIAINYQRDKNYILETIRASYYDKEIVKIGLKNLGIKP